MSPESPRDALVLFRQGHLDLAIPLESCLEVHRNMEITPVLDGSGAEGVIDLRGRLVPIVDLETALGVASRQAILRRRIIICGHGELQLGLVVDDVLGITEEPFELRRRQEAFPPGLGGTCAGVAQIQGQLHFVLDIPAILTQRAPEAARDGGQR